MNLIIEKYKSSYHEKVIKLITKIQQIEFKLPITYDDQPDLASIHSFYDSFYVALYDQILVGTIGYKKIDDYAIIRKMFVKNEFRGKTYSIAQKLLEELEIEIANQHIRTIYLGTTEFFKAAQRFYEKNNYIEIPELNLPKSFPIMSVDTKFYYKNLLS